MLTEHLLTIRDETPMGELIHELNLSFDHPTVTAREIIEARVRGEVAAYNRKAETRFQGLVMPSGAEQESDAYRLKKPRTIDADEQVAIALRAFESNGFLILADDLQIEDLDQAVPLRPELHVSFVKLTPLVGG